MARFSSFAILAAMRTGSNLLEETLNAVPGVACLGEAFNPVFIAHPNQGDLLGITQAERDARPLTLLARIGAAPGLNGFRYFLDHDPRVLDAILNDAACAKIVLSRNPADSYVSLKIARETGQWRLNDARSRKAARVRFDPAEFAEYVTQLDDFRHRVQHVLQTTGQTAFWLDYGDLTDAGILTGLLRFLGVEGAAEPARSLVRQNPEPLTEKVTNPDEMSAALSALDPFGLNRPPGFEPRRGPAVPGFVVATGAPVLFMPVRGGPVARVTGWLAGLGAPGQRGTRTGFTQSTLRDWMREHPGHRRFTVVRHPVARAHAAFRDLFLGATLPDLADQIGRMHKIDLKGIDANPRRQGAAFAQFLRFVKASLNGQTAFRADPAWAGQTAILSGFAGFAPPDLVIREDSLAADLAHLCGQLGIGCPPLDDAAKPGPPFAVPYDDDIEALARQAYARDYLTFGFADWRA